MGENRAAVRLYESCGFSIAAHFPGDAEGCPCTCLRMCLPASRHRERPPRPSKRALRLAGFSEGNPGRALRGADGIWRWAASERPHETRAEHAYKEDLSDAREALLASVQDLAGLAPTPAAEVAVVNLGSSSVDLEIRVWIKNAAADS